MAMAAVLGATCRECRPHAQDLGPVAVFVKMRKGLSRPRVGTCLYKWPLFCLSEHPEKVLLPHL